MIKKYSLVLIALLCSFFYGFGQVTTIDFETAGVGYTPSTTFGSGNTDTFNRTNITINGNNTFHWVAEDISGNPSIDLDQIDITGSDSFTFAIDFSYSNAIQWDTTDELLITYSIDGGAYQNLIWVQSIPDGDNFNSTAALDLDFNNDGDVGQELSTSVFLTFTTTSILLSSNSTLDINFQFINLTSNGEGILIDNIIITETSACTDTVDFANIQFPNSSPQNITVGDNFDVFAQVYEPTVTEAAGAGAGIEAWIGFNTTNTDPSTWVETDWTLATFNVQDVNNDEFTSEIGSGLAAGSYYYASRFRLNGCNFTYGGTGGVWNNDSVQLNVNEDTLDFYNLQFPEVGSINLGGVFDVFGQVFEAGVTPGAGQGAGISAWVGYSTSNSDPSTWTNWVVANYNSLCVDCNSDQNDEYFVDIGSSLPAGTYYYATRYKLNSGPFTYGGILADGSAGNQWDGSTYISGVLTIIDPNPPTCNFSDDFNRVDSSTIGGGWTEIGGNASILSNELLITTGSATGLDYVYQDVSGSYTTQLDSSTDIVTWEFNMQQSRADPSGFANSNYGIGFILGGTSSDVNSGNGYAVVLGQTGTTDNVRLVSYTGGISNSTNIITGGSDIGNDYLSIRVVFDPATSTWELFVRDDGTAFASPSTLDVIDSEGVTINSTFTSSNLDFVAAIWNHATGATETASFDNVCISIETVCTPAHSITNFSPTSGPENTEVTVTGTGFTASTTANFNGATANIISQTSTEIVLIVPSGASTGVITITESSCDLETNSDFTIIDNVNIGCQGSVNTSEIFISEITDATSGSLSYIEIYNGTGSTVDLSNYTLEIRYNSGNTKDDFTMSGNLIDGGIHVVSTNVDTPCSVTGGNGSLNDEASTMSGVNTPKNGADCISLFKNYINAANPGTLIDVWGDCSDKNWRENLGVAIGNEGFDFRRLATAIPIPNTTFTLADWNIIDWEDDTCTDDDYSDIGSYTSGLTPVVTLNPNALSSCDLTANLTVAGTEGFNDSGDTQELTYQWYYSAPGDSGWTAITNAPPYSGATTTILTISNVLNTLDYQFYCQIREDDVTCYQATNATRLDVDKTTWNGSAWDNNTPDLNTIAVIDGNYDTTTSGSFEACNLLINTNNELNVRNNTYIKIQNNVIVDGSIIVQTKGALVQVDDVGTFTNNGTSRVLKTTATFNSTLSTYNYTYWSSPVVNANVVSTFPNPVGNRRYYFQAENYLDKFAETGNNNATVLGQDDIDDDGNDWQIASSTMDIGSGYAVTAVSGPPMPGNYSDTADFIGEFNTGDIIVNVYKDDSEIADNNWNFIGNPYPSAIDADLFLTENTNFIAANPAPPLSGAIFLWSQGTAANATANGNENLNFSQDDYAVINGMMGTAGTTGVIPNSYIPSGQGFFVSYDHNATNLDASGSIKRNEVKFTNSMRVTGDNEQFFRSSTNIGKNNSDNLENKLWLNLNSDNGVFSQIGIGYKEGASNNYDSWYFDTPRNLSTDYNSIIYSIIESDDRKFTIQGKDPNSLTLEEIIHLGFDTSITVATLYSLSIDKFEGAFLTNNTIYLKDNLMNIVHDLSSNNYTFTSEVGEFKERFEIVFTQESLSLDDVVLSSNNLNIIELKNGLIQFKLSSTLEMKSIEIIDLLGRTLYKLEANGNSITYNLSNLSQATYIAKVKLSNDYIITKKAIKRK